MPPADFQSCLDVDQRMRRALLDEQAEAQWADFGRTIHDTMVSEKFVTAIQTALLSTDPGGTRTIARKLRTYLLTGTIAR